MSSSPVTVGPDTDARDTVELMLTLRIKALPVVVQRRVVGVLNRSNVVHSMARADSNIRVDIETLLRSAGFSHEVSVEDGVVHLTGADAGTADVVRAVAASVPGVVLVRVDR